MNWLGSLFSEGLLQYLLNFKTEIMAPFAISTGNVVDDIYIATVWHPLLHPVPKSGDKLYLVAYGGQNVTMGDYPSVPFRLVLAKRTLISADDGPAAVQAEGQALYRAGEVVARKLLRMPKSGKQLSYYRGDNTKVTLLAANIVQSVDSIQVDYIPQISDENNEVHSTAVIISGTLTPQNRGLI